MTERRAEASGGIVLRGASFAIRGKTILDRLDLTLTEARIGIIGRNGSGKTTLLRLMAGLVAPTSGSVTVDGIDPAHDRKTMLSRLGILFQNPDHQILFPTVVEELSFGLHQQGHASPEAAARAALMAEGRAHWAELPVSSLSQGQRQWLCLLAVLLMDPATILLDEPFAALDLPTAQRLTRRLNALPQRLVTITHAPDSLTRADRILWLDSGRIAMDGPPATVLPAYRAEMDRIGATEAD